MRQHGRSIRWCIFLLLVPAAGEARAADAPDARLAADAAAAMKKAAKFYREQVASHGGYVYYYSTDLAQRWGEGMATADQIWVQPPGTPTVGMAYLTAYHVTRDREYLDAALAAGEALMHGQLRSGGWTNCVDFDPRGERIAAYRNGRGKGKNNSTLDDGITQSAIRFLVLLDRALEFKNAQVHKAAKIALDALLAAQFPNGGFPQVWTGPAAPQPIVKPSYPAYDWRTEGKIKEYWDRYTLNDNVAGHVTAALITAWQVYQDDRYKQALSKLGDFLILAQMPDPQPAWCQQYGYDMHPIWARRFEPPAVSGSESQDVLEALMTIYEATGDKKYLEPLPRAIGYLRRSRLNDGRLARYYELQTNKPLYMTRQGDNYSLTHDDANLPDHYGWKIISRLDAIERRLRALEAGSASAASAPEALPLEQQVRRIIGELDEQGRWVSTYQGEGLVGQPKFKPGFSYLSSDVFSRNLTTLAEYVQHANTKSP